eukprot:TRINITY_DN910_c0_g1_i1.p1 TRINITY_DN910_c0_g1~~TRINITY_DN910_c0_g1_i1.p1  ORF type:complete len:265 (+),score=24.01 TRINITY_DN910_c0_g1_i1:888-1682(+)
MSNNLTKVSVIGIIKLLSVLVLQIASQAQVIEEIDDGECIERHKTCLFIVAMQDTGAHALVDVLNQHSKVQIQGTGGGVFLNLKRCIARILQEGSWGQSYNQVIKNGKYGVAWYNPEKKIHFQRALVALFNVWFATGAQQDDIIGYVESYFGTQKHDYQTFKAEINMLKDLCHNPKIILQISYDLPRLGQRPYWQWKTSEPEPMLNRLFYYYQTYHYEYPNDTLIVTDDQIRANSRFQDIFSFIGLEYDPQTYLLGRFGEKSYF